MGVRALAGSLITTSLWKVQLEPFCDLPEGPLAIRAAGGTRGGTHFITFATPVDSPRIRTSNTLEALHDR